MAVPSSTTTVSPPIANPIASSNPLKAKSLKEMQEAALQTALGNSQNLVETTCADVDPSHPNYYKVKYKKYGGPSGGFSSQPQKKFPRASVGPGPGPAGSSAQPVGASYGPGANANLGSGYSEQVPRSAGHLQNYSTQVSSSQPYQTKMEDDWSDGEKKKGEFLTDGVENLQMETPSRQRLTNSQRSMTDRWSVSKGSTSTGQGLNFKAKEQENVHNDFLGNFFVQTLASGTT